MTTAQYKSNNSLTPDIKWTSFEKRNNLDELINIPIKTEERFVIQISFRTQGPNITADPRSAVFSKSANPLDSQHKSPIRALFKAKSVYPKTYLPPSLSDGSRSQGSDKDCIDNWQFCLTRTPLNSATQAFGVFANSNQDYTFVAALMATGFGLLPENRSSYYTLLPVPLELSPTFLPGELKDV